MATTGLGLFNTGAFAGDFEHSDVNKISDSVELVARRLSGLVGAGFFSAADMVVTLVGGAQQVQLSAGGAILGDSLLLPVYQDAPRTLGVADGIVGSGPGTLNYLYSQRVNGSLVPVVVINQTGVAPANSMLAGTFIMGSVEGNTLVTAPAGRVNLNGLLSPGRPGGLVADSSFVVGAEAANVIQVTVQLRDLALASLVQRAAFEVWLSDAAHAAPSATVPSGGWVAGVGYLVHQRTTNILALAATNANGTLRLDITHSGARTWFLNVLVGAKVFASPAIAFV